MRLIDADALKAVKFHPLPYTHIVPTDADAESYKLGWNDAIDAIIESAPTIDAVPVVRCKDCDYRNGDYCHLYGGIAYEQFVRMTDFCSRGAREDSEQDG